jgi:hypothetical protein
MKYSHTPVSTIALYAAHVQDGPDENRICPITARRHAT